MTARQAQLLVWGALAAVLLAGTLVPALLFTRSAALFYEALSPHFWAGLLVGVALVVLRVTPDGPAAFDSAQARKPGIYAGPADAGHLRRGRLTPGTTAPWFARLL